MSDITTVNTNLPATINELAQFVLFNREKVIAIKAQSRSEGKRRCAHTNAGVRIGFA